MKISFVEYENYYVGICHAIEISDSIIEYLKEIHIMFIGNKQLYVFLNKFCLIVTSENIDDFSIQSDIAKNFSTTNIPVKVNGIHSAFIFDLHDESCGIEARLNVTSSKGYLVRLNSCLEFYSKSKNTLEFGIIKSS